MDNPDLIEFLSLLWVFCVYTQEENKDKICQLLMIYDVLIKRKPFLDSLSEGLETFKAKMIISSYPKFFTNKFVAPIRLTKSQVKDVIKTANPPGMDCRKNNLLRAIGVFIDESTEEGERISWLLLVIMQLAVI